MNSFENAKRWAVARGMALEIVKAAVPVYSRGETYICPNCGAVRGVGLVHSCLDAGRQINRRVETLQPLTLRILPGSNHSSGRGCAA